MDAIAEVYASTFSRILLNIDVNEDYWISMKNGILSKRSFGTGSAVLYANVRRVAFSRNEFAGLHVSAGKTGWSVIVPGLGTRAVDRMGNDYPILISPKRPSLQVNPLVEEKIKYSPRYMDVINLETGMIETVDAVTFSGNTLRSSQNSVTLFLSMKVDDSATNCSVYPEKADLVVTFQNLFEKTDFLRKLNVSCISSKRKLVHRLTWSSPATEKNCICCSVVAEPVGRYWAKPVPKDIPEDRKLFATKKYVTTVRLKTSNTSCMLLLRSTRIWRNASRCRRSRRSLVNWMWSFRNGSSFSWSRAMGQ